MLDSVYLHTKSRDYLPEVVWPILKRAVECAIENWRKADRGIWDVRGEPQPFTSSKLMCWVAYDRGARLAELHGDLGLATSWQAMADEIKSDLCEGGVDSRGVFVQHNARRPWMHRSCSSRWSGSCRLRILACEPRCWPSPTS